LRDAWCAVVAARHAGLLSKEIAEGLASWQPVQGRGNLVELSSGTLIVDETYNANPDSVRCAVESLLTGDNFRDRKKVVILGKMAELGDFTESLHKDLGNWLKDKPIDMLVTMGDVAALIGEGARGSKFSISNLSDLEETLTFIRKLEGDRPCIMLKGSHSTNMHELIKRLI
jgi:UDP-N-acetylmuramyl pentapeptide synthase